MFKKQNHIMRKIWSLAFGLVTSISLVGQTTIHCWDFNSGSTTTGGAKWASPLPTAARVTGNGSITHNFGDTENFAGSTENACVGSPSGASFVVRDVANNGSQVTAELSTLGFEDIELSFAARRTGTGFDSVIVAYSTNGGTTFTVFDDFNPSSSGFSTYNFDFSVISDANDNDDFQVRLTFFGATSGAGNTRIDNLKLEGEVLSGTVPPRSTVLHYWHFNDMSSGAVTSVEADTTAFVVAPEITYPGTGSGYMDRNSGDGNTDNVRFNEPAGNSLRARNPSDTRSLDIELPTTGYEDIVFSYEVYRSNNGQLGQVVEYTTDGTTYNFLDSLTINTSYQTFFWDFTGMGAIEDNPDFKIRINFFGQNTGSSGNNRFDNFVLEGEPKPFVPVYSIASLKSVDADGVADSLNVNCAIEGIVSGGNLRGNGVEFWFIDSTNSAGLLVRQPGFTAYTPSEGDVLRVFGNVGQFRGLIQFTVDSIQVLDSAFTLPAPAVVTVLDESTEGRLVRINGLSLVSPTQWTGSGSGFNVDVTDGTNLFLARIVSAITLYNDTTPTTPFDLIGHGGQFSSTAGAPHNDGYQILPRYSEDLIPDTTAPVVPIVINRYPISSLRSVNADGIADSLGVACSIVGIVSGGNLLSNGAQFWFIDSTNTAGLLVRQPGFTNYTPTEGDVLEIYGNVSQFRGLIQFSIDSLDVLGDNFTLPSPAVVTELDESTEGRLIEIEDLDVIDPSQWTGMGTGFNVDVTNGVDTFLVRVVEPTTLFNDSVPTRTFNLRGHGSQFTTSTPALDGYQIQPRYSEDLIFSMSVDVESLTEIRAYPNPTQRFVTFELSVADPAQMVIYNTAGQLVTAMDIEHGLATIDTDNWTAGMYIARITQGSHTVTVRVVVQ